MLGKRLTDVSLAGRSIFLESAAAIGHFLANATLAVEISTVFSSAANSKFG